MKLKLWSLGNNRKLAETIPVFNLPQGITCPGKTANCAKICYAGKAERCYKAAKAMRARNLIASKVQTFVECMILELMSLVGCIYARWHESGDAYCQAYLDKIFEISAKFPKITFLMYTKSFDLDWSKKPANINVYWSTDSSTVNKVPAGVTAHTVMKGEVPPAKTATCVHVSDKHYCGSECFTCWKGKKSVYFNQH